MNSSLFRIVVDPRRIPFPRPPFRAGGPFRARCLWPLFCFVATVATGAPEPKALTDLRTTFERQLDSAVAPFLDTYVGELAKLENVRAIREDYEGAIRARDVRRRLEGETSSPDKKATDRTVPGVIELPMAAALLNGNTISYDPVRKALTGFRKARHAATWDVLKVTPGWFDVIVTYGCAESRTVRPERRGRDEDAKPVEMKTGGTFAFYENTNLSKDTSPPIRRTVVSTGGWDKLVTRNIGKLKLTGASATLKLEAVEPGNDGIMYLRSLKLVPSSPSGEGASGEANALRGLRTQYRQQVEAEIKDKLTAYVRELKELEERHTTESRLEDALETRTERMRVQSLLDNPTAVLPKP